MAKRKPTKPQPSKPVRGRTAHRPVAGTAPRKAAKPTVRARNAGKPAGAKSKRAHSGGGKTDAGPVAPWFYGQHAVYGALANAKRRCRRLLVAKESLAKRRETVSGLLAARAEAPVLEVVDREDIAARLPEGAVHQGLALQVEPLEPLAIEDLADLADLADLSPTASPGVSKARRPIVVALDQVTDPQNVGAILRSAAAFGAIALLVTRDNAAPESGALAKAASGALEIVPTIQVTNLSRALATLKQDGFWCLGLAGDAERSLVDAAPDGAVVLVLGAEGSGLRRLTRETCDLLVRLPTRGPIDSLNVSNAAAVALYALLAG